MEEFANGGDEPEDEPEREPPSVAVAVAAWPQG